MRYILAFALAFCLGFASITCISGVGECVKDTQVVVLEIPGDLFSHTGPQNDIERDQLDMFNKMRADFPNIEISLMWHPCFMVNAFYDPRSKTIRMCEEIEDLGQGSVMALAHEFGHAITHQVTDTMAESDADEIGALEMLKYGKHQGIIDQVKWFKSMNFGHIKGDPHPSPFYRAWELACLELGSRQEFGKCPDFYQATRLKWLMRLNLDSL